LLAKKYFDGVIKLLKQAKKPLRLILSPSEQSKLTSLTNLGFTDEETIDLLEEIKKLDSEYELLEQGIQKKTFLEKYIAFIRANNGNKPNPLSSNSENDNLEFIGLGAIVLVCLLKYSSVDILFTFVFFSKVTALTCE
jgi:hypothetical protein